MSPGAAFDHAELFLDDAGDIVWSLVTSGLVWLVLGLAAVVIGFLVVRRLGWLALPSRARWPTVVTALVLLLITWPMLVGAGLVGGLRDASVESLRRHAATPELSEPVGAALILPMVAAHTLTSGGGAAELEAALSARGDVSFLLASDQRRATVDRIGDQVRRAVLAELPRPDSAIGRWLLDGAVDVAIDQARHRARRYLALFDGLRADPDGGLSFASASRHVGRRLVDRELVPLVRTPFDHLRYLLLGIALLFPLLVLAVIRLVAWSQVRNPPLQPTAVDLPAATARRGDGSRSDPG